MAAPHLVPILIYAFVSLAVLALCLLRLPQHIIDAMGWLTPRRGR